MLVLKITPECRRNEKNRFWGKFIKHHRENEAVRYNITVNGCVHTVVEVCETELYDAQLSRLLKAYSGKIIVPRQYENHPAFAQKLFDASPYRCLAAVSSLINYLKYNGNKNISLCVCVTGAEVFGILAEVLPFVKSLTVVSDRSAEAFDFSEKCYVTYGVKPFITSQMPQTEFDICADLTVPDEKGRSEIGVFGKTAVLYADARYYSQCGCFETFCEWGIRGDVLCAAFGTMP